MKILFPGPAETLVCQQCWGPVESDLGTNDDAEGYWCDKCCDFIDVEVRPKSS